MKGKTLVIAIIAFFFLMNFFIAKKTDILEQPKTKENIELAIYLNDEETNAIPSKDSGYYYDREKSTCSNGAYINWDSVSWSPVVNNMSEHKTRCELHFTTTYTEGILNGADPVLKDELVPITIENDGTVKKADLESEWYSYANKNWANAVILEDQYDSLNTQGKVYGATKEDGYVSFDGIDDYIDLGLENYEFTNGVTLVASLKTNSDSNIQTYKILSNNELGGGCLQVYNGKLNFELYINDVYYNISTDITSEDYFTFIGIYDGNQMKIYVNGELKNTNTIDGIITSSIAPFYIAADPTENPSVPIKTFGDFEIKNVQIYDRAISEEEVTALNEGRVLNSEGLLKYVDFTNKSYEENEIIPEEAIESYFVWISKYRYQLWDLGQYDSLTAIDESKVHEIPIIFGDYNTSDNVEGECTTPMESGATGNCAVGDYMTHPAFLSIPSTGFWVGKFETGYAGATSTAEAEQNVNDSSKIIVKPNTYSWRGIQVANAFYSSYDYQRDLDSHMMKNTEWGAVAYLQHSAYGSATSVRINNNSDYVTGYQANNEPTCGYTGTNEECNTFCNDGTCNTAYPNSNLAGTTGNITGVFDMSGGAWEYVMGVMLDQNGDPMSGRSGYSNSGFNGILGCPTCDASGLTSLTTGYDFPNEKYYDTYLYTTVNEQFHRRILGDATGEMGPFSQATYMTQTRNFGSWYNDFIALTNLNTPWYNRGGARRDGLLTGVFGSGNTTGMDNGVSFRIILTPTGGAS